MEMFKFYSGSRAYGVNSTHSDVDIVSVFMPEREVLFPVDYIEGFSQPRKFKHVEQTFYTDPETQEKVDHTKYTFPKFMRMLADGNPNVITMLFTSDDDVLCVHECFKPVLENKSMFFHKGLHEKFSGFAHSLRNRVEDENFEEACTSKDAYHMIRVALYGLQLFSTGDLNMKDHSNLLMDVRSGKYSTQELLDMQNRLSQDMFMAHVESDFPDVVDEGAVEALVRRVMACYFKCE